MQFTTAQKKKSIPRCKSNEVCTRLYMENHTDERNQRRLNGEAYWDYKLEIQHSKDDKIVSKSIYRFKTIPINITARYFEDGDKTLPKFIWKGKIF